MLFVVVPQKMRANKSSESTIHRTVINMTFLGFMNSTIMACMYVTARVYNTESFFASCDNTSLALKVTMHHHYLALSPGERNKNNFWCDVYTCGMASLTMRQIFRHCFEHTDQTFAAVAIKFTKTARNQVFLHTTRGHNVDTASLNMSKYFVNGVL